MLKIVKEMCADSPFLCKKSRFKTFVFLLVKERESIERIRDRIIVWIIMIERMKTTLYGWLM